MTAARRLAAILAADVAGYSRLMGEDEAGTATAVRERRGGDEICAAASSPSRSYFAACHTLPTPSPVASPGFLSLEYV
jgi:hypothetical protein